ncbi:MAG: tRNA uridine-5-carboxymethylaminomethyl(34) synthesis GTPase MnmE [Desulfuromonas sp.]|nr:MAG: tRNA uridine-5-carboxymethylaminomethyl(34) synthesis GTPase MnmE [Desulfuromonas sp.]
MFNTNDTIIALATPPGEGGVAIVRISGSASQSALLEHFVFGGAKTNLRPHYLHYGFIYNRRGVKIDEVMAVFMPAPRSYTCEDVVEIHCHGGQQVVKSIIDLYLSVGLRLALPGEFTYRAYTNGRLDLSQAEAVARLIHARSEKSQSLALAQVDGLLSRSIFQYKEMLRESLVLVEAWIDFPEEDIPPETSTGVLSQVSGIIDKIGGLLDTYHTGRALVSGVSLLLLGRPNVGKSSLLNALLGEDRAIVNSTPGTTRDTLEESLTMGGFPVRLIDSAGLRDTGDQLELEGIRRAQGKVSVSDLVFVVVDASEGLTDEDKDVLEVCDNSKVFLVVNKIDKNCDQDLSCFLSAGLPVFAISAKTGQGVDRLREGVASFFDDGVSSPESSVVVTEERHRDSLSLCRDSLLRLRSAVEAGDSLEFWAIELRAALDALGKISGETTPDDVLEGIFSRFCIGK